MKIFKSHNCDLKNDQKLPRIPVTFLRQNAVIYIFYIKALTPQKL